MAGSSLITARQETLLAAEAVVSPRTVKNVYAGRGNTYSRERVERAAKALHLPPPPRAAALPAKSATPA